MTKIIDFLDKIKNKKNWVLFIKSNYLYIFFVISFTIKQIFFTREINGYFLPFPEILLNILFYFVLAALLFIPVIFSKRKLIVSIILAILFTTIIIFDLTYFHFFHSLPSVAIFSLIGNVDDVGPAVINVFNLYDLIYLIDIFIAILLFKKIKSEFKVEKRHLLYGSVFFMFIILSNILFFGLDHAFVERTITRIYDNRLVAERYGFFGSHIFDIYRNVSQSLKKISPEEKTDVLEWINNNRKTEEINDFTGIAKGKNVIVIQVESLQNFVIGEKADGQEITPSLNKLLKDSYYFENYFFQMGAGHTSDVDFTINTSYYPLKEAAVTVSYGKDNFSALPKDLKENNYSSYAYHGYNRNFWNRDTFFRSMGYDKYIAREGYPDGPIVNMGLNDETFLRKTAEYIKEQPKPSFSYVITLSNHNPFHLENVEKSINLDSSKYPEMVYGYLENVNYSDRTLGIFFELLKKEGLYDDSLIVLYGDHMSKIEPFEVDNLKYDRDSAPKYKGVPLFIKLPMQNEGKIIKSVSSHIDIKPTILNLLGIKTKSFMFGSDLFSNVKKFFGSVSYYDDKTIVTDDKIYRYTNPDLLICKEWSKGDISQKDEDCQDIIERDKIEQEISEKIIRYNLFDEVNTK